MFARFPAFRNRRNRLSFPGRGSRRRPAASRNRRLACEPLEQRTVLSVVLDGAVLDLGINDDGSLITDYDPNGVGAAFNGVEFLTRGTPWAFFTVSANGDMYTKAAPLPAPDPFAVTVTDTSDGGTLSARVAGTVTPGLELERTLSFADDGSVVRFTITLSNTGSTVFENVAFVEGIDPDQGYDYDVDFRHHTYNDVVLDGDFARAHIVQDGSATLTIGIGSADPRATASVEHWAPDPFETIDSPHDPDGAFEDRHLHVAFDFGTLAAGESVTAEYAMVVAATPEEADEFFGLLGDPSNGPPVAVDDSFVVNEDATLTVAAQGVLANDTDPDGNPLSAATVTGPTNGALALNPDGSFVYTPNPDFYGADSFVYEVSDGQGGVDTATVSVTVNPVIDAVIDIRPGSDNNRINLASKGVVPVAILSTSLADGEAEDFDAASLFTLDLKSFTFGDSRAGYGHVNPRRMVVEDVDGDGDLDLLLKFSMKDILKVGALDAESVDAALSVEYGGGHFTAHDAVSIKAPKVKAKA